MRTKQLARGTLLAALCISLAAGLPGPVSLTSAEGEPDAVSENAANGALNEPSSRGGRRGIDYAQYLSLHEGAASPQGEIVVDAAEYASVQGTGFETRGGFEGMEGEVLLTGEQGQVEWEIQVPESGLYHMSVLYYPIAGKSSGIERALLIDGEVPFEEAAYLQFDRIWDNELEEVERDNRARSPLSC